MLIPVNYLLDRESAHWFLLYRHQERTFIFDSNQDEDAPVVNVMLDQVLVALRDMCRCLLRRCSLVQTPVSERGKRRGEEMCFQLTAYVMDLLLQTSPTKIVDKHSLKQLFDLLSLMTGNS